MLECDLIMKGGVTSGVVYPHAITEISEKYRLRNIGGTSAGAIGAVCAAAAEYRRQTGSGDMAGFNEISKIADELGKDMQSLFQPTPQLNPLFDLLMAAVSDRAKAPGGLKPALVRAILKAFSGRLILGVIIVVIFAILGVAAESWWPVILGLVVAVVGTGAIIGFDLYRLIFVGLPKNDFGICSGRTMGNAAKPGFSDWIADKIDAIAGNVAEDGTFGAPLTVGQLESCGITIATMTTDLSSRRPYRLPLRNKLHYFSKAEFEKLFPPRVINYLIEKGKALKTENPGLPKDLYQLPSGSDFPVLLVARMSLSFPGLIRAVPLYRFDDQLREGPEKRAVIRRCLFSDGGLSSNFPIHFFDAMLPSRPTFGIALSSWEKVRHGDKRIDLPDRGRQSTHLPISEIRSVGGFMSSILNTAKDWQDTIQSMLPGYAERIVTVRLDNDREGGMNLAMDTDTIEALAGYGRNAGAVLKADFDFDQHRYNRAVSLLPVLEDALDHFAATYNREDEGSLTMTEVITEFPTQHYPNSKTWRRESLNALAEALTAIGITAAEKHRSSGAKSVREGDVPATDSQIRLVAIADRVPEEARVEA